MYNSPPPPPPPSSPQFLQIAYIDRLNLPRCTCTLPHHWPNLLTHFGKDANNLHVDKSKIISEAMVENILISWLVYHMGPTTGSYLYMGTWELQTNSKHDRDAEILNWSTLQQWSAEARFSLLNKIHAL